MQNQQATRKGVGWIAGIWAMLATCALACVFALAGCGSATAAKATLSDSFDGDSATAMVTAVDGNTITINVMDGQMPDGAPGGEPPAKPGEGSESSNSTSESTASSAPNESGSEAVASEPPAKPEGYSSDSASANEPPAKPEGDQGGSTGTGDNTSTESEGDSNSSAAPAGEPPAKPEGDSSNGVPTGEPPAKPEGDANAQGSESGTPPDAPGAPSGGTQMTLTIPDESIIFTSTDGKEAQGSLADITEGTMLQLTIENGANVTKIVAGQGGMGGQPAGQPGGNGGPGQGSSTVNNGTGATTLEDGASTTGETYDSTSADENAVRVEGGASAAIADATITKTGDSSSSEDSDFYGLNAAVLAYDGSKLAVSGGTVSTDSSGSNGIFAYGEGTEITVADTKIRCMQGNSGGIEVAGGATLTATNLDIDTQGESSAAIRSDRGGGTEVVTGGTYSTHGKHSPAVYSTADVTVNGATLSAENTEGVVIEGKNSVKLVDCDTTGNINGNATRTGVVNNVMIYQSMSGDASEGTGSFTMSGGSFDAAHGTLFYVTNTDATIDLEAADITLGDGQLLVVAGNDGQWGTEGKNGGTVTFTATDQTLEGSITVDEISSLDLQLKEESSYVGSINASGAAGTVNVTLEEGTTWKLDGDSYITGLSGNTAGIDLNGHTLYVNGEAWTA